MRVVNLLDWSISTRLRLGFGLLIFILVLCTIVSSVLIQQADDDLTEAVDVQAPLEQAVLQMKISAAESAQAVFDYARHKDRADLEAAYDAESAFEATNVKFIGLADTEQLKEVGRETAQLYGKFTKSRHEIVALVDQQYAGHRSYMEDIEFIGNLVGEKLRAAIDSTTPEAARKLEGAFGMELAAAEASDAIESYVAELDPKSQKAILGAQADFQTSAELYQKTTLSPYEESWLNEIVKGFTAAMNDANEMIIATDNLNARLAQFKQDHNTIEAYLDTQIEPLIQGRSARASDDSRNALTAATVSIIVLGIMGIMVGSVSLWATHRRFNRSVKGLQQGARMIVDGKLEHRFDVDTKDEIGQVGFALNQMLQNLGRSRAALGESEETAWALLDATTDSVILTDTKGVILASNEIAAERFGKSLEQMIDENLYDLLPADLMASRKAQIAEVIRSGKPLHFEDERDGVIYEQRIFPVFDPKTGRVRRLAIFSSDITTRKWVEEVAERLGRRNELILEAAGEGIYGLDTHGKTTFVNPAAAQMLGFKPEDLIGERHHELVHHSRPDGTPYPHQECPIYAAFKDGIARTNVDNEVFWRKDGTAFPVEYTSTPIIEDEKIVGAVVTFRDISDRRKVETALRRSAERYRAILESSATLIVSVDEEGIIIDSNTQSQRTLGYLPEELTGQSFLEYIHSDHKAHAQESLKSVLTNGFEYDIKFKMIQKNGKTVDVNMNAAAMQDEDGKYVRTICMIDRITR